MTRRTAVGITVLAGGLLVAGGCTSPIDRNARVRYDLSPELDTLHQRSDDVANSLALMSDENWRMFWEDMGRFWYVDRPSRLTFEPLPR
jgi:hypothetical protein